MTYEQYQAQCLLKGFEPTMSEKQFNEMFKPKEEQPKQPKPKQKRERLKCTPAELRERRLERQRAKRAENIANGLTAKGTKRVIPIRQKNNQKKLKS